MEANELMIGDWVKSRGEIEQVTSVYEGYICTDTFEDSHDYYFDPIRLTPEILEKNFEFLYRSVPGGIYAAAQAVDTYRAGSVTINYVHQYQYAEILNIRYVVFRYVHELQHALKLCGIDKTIEL